MWCFKRRLDQARLLQSDLERYGPVRKKKRYKRNRIFERKRQKRKSWKHKNKSKYHSLGKAPRFPKSDPFTNKFLENPLIADDEFDMDWSNPAFDSEGATMYDAAITIQCWYRMVRYDTVSIQLTTLCLHGFQPTNRVRVPYLLLKEATILAQSLYRGLIVRREVPRLKKEKQFRDVSTTVRNCRFTQVW